MDNIFIYSNLLFFTNLLFVCIYAYLFLGLQHIFSIFARPIMLQRVRNSARTLLKLGSLIGLLLAGRLAQVELGDDILPHPIASSFGIQPK